MTRGLALSLSIAAHAAVGAVLFLSLTSGTPRAPLPQLLPETASTEESLFDSIGVISVESDDAPAKNSAPSEPETSSEAANDAPKTASGTAIVAGAGEAGSPGSKDALNSYLGSVRQKLSNALRPPPLHSASPVRAVLKLTLLENGTVQNPIIDQSSGSPEFDRSVLDALGKALPFPIFTREMGSLHQVTLKLPIEIRPRHQ